MSSCEERLALQDLFHPLENTIIPLSFPEQLDFYRLEFLNLPRALAHTVSQRVPQRNAHRREKVKETRVRLGNLVSSMVGQIEFNRYSGWVGRDLNIMRETVLKVRNQL